MSAEQLLRQALHQADAYAPSPDLFARVQRSIEEDRAHRRRVRLAVASLVAGIVAIAGYLAVLVEVVDGRPTWPWWSLELLTTVVLIVIVVVLGPLIRRFGRIYVATVFRAHPATGHRFLALLDIAYYLVFASFILLTTSVEPDRVWLVANGLTEQLQHIAFRIGGMLMLMGVLHSITIAALPALGLIFTDTWRRLPPSQRS